MATVNKDFKIKSGLIVEGTTGTINGYNILTESQDSIDFIVDTIGGTATPVNTANTVVKRDGFGNFAAGEITANLIGDVTGTVSDISNHNTDALGEGTTNKYFTDQRALDATNSAYDHAGAATDAYNDAVLTAQQYTDGEIADEVTARNLAVQGAYNDAVADAATDATTKANAAEQNAKDYTDLEIAAEVTRSNNYADSAATNAENNAKAYADGLSSGLNWKAAVNVLATSNVALTGSTPLAVDGHTLSDGYRVLLKGQSTDTENGIYELSITGGSYTLTRPTDADAASELIGAAVFVMEGNTYASTAWVQADHYLSTFAGQSWTQFSGQGTYLAGNGLILDGTTFEIDTAVTETVAGAQDKADVAESSAKAYTDTREIAITSAYQGYADGVALSAENAAKSHADGLVFDEVTDRNNAINNAINALTTTDIEEGTNEYFTDSRAKTSAADLLTGATLSNITITGTGAGLTITAENGVAQSTTDDLAEGATNKYFSDSLALSAINSATQIQPQAIDITWVRREEATWTGVATASKATCHSASTSEGSMKYLVRVTASVGGTWHSHVTEVLATVDGSNGVAVVEYGTIYTSTEPLATVTVEWNAATSKYDLNVTTANNNSEVLVAATLIADRD